ncbi:MAG: hypothetical protein MZV70_56845 [Desulfobacterales bacterium]|nr:hypothetical protein [Desulfobacterales bacterium]
MRRRRSTLFDSRFQNLDPRRQRVGDTQRHAVGRRASRDVPPVLLLSWRGDRLPPGPRLRRALRTLCPDDDLPAGREGLEEAGDQPAQADGERRGLRAVDRRRLPRARRGRRSRGRRPISSR